MVRYIERAQIYLVESYFYLRLEASLAEPVVLANLPWGKMVRRKKGADVVKELNTLVIPPGETLDDRGYWRDIDYYFIQKDPDVPLSFFFRDLSHEFHTTHEFGHASLYDQVVTDMEFVKCLGVNSPPATLQEGMNPIVFEKVFRGVFNIGGVNFDFRSLTSVYIIVRVGVKYVSA